MIGKNYYFFQDQIMNLRPFDLIPTMFVRKVVNPRQYGIVKIVIILVAANNLLKYLCYTSFALHYLARV